MTLEIFKWIRSKRIFIILFICSLSGIISPLIAYYSDSLIKNLSGNSSAKIILPDPTWESVMESYFKNIGQLILFIVVFLVAQACIIGKNESLQLFYKTRSNKASMIYTPKVVISIIIATLGIIFGDLCATYMDWALFGNKLKYSNLFSAFGLHLLVFLMFVLLGATIAIWMSSPFLAAGIVEIIVLTSGALVGTKFYDRWLPSALLSPTKYLNEIIRFESIWRIILFVLGVMIICVFAIQMKPIRKTIKRK